MPDDCRSLSRYLWENEKMHEGSHSGLSRIHTQGILLGSTVAINQLFISVTVLFCHYITRRSQATSKPRQLYRYPIMREE